MVYAVVKTGGKQYKVSAGDVIEVESLGLEANSTYTFPEVLLYASDDKVQVGTPTVDVAVLGIVIDEVKGEKIRVSKYKSKVRYRRVTGHRQHLTKIKIESVGSHKAENKKTKELATPKVEKMAKVAKAKK